MNKIGPARYEIRVCGRLGDHWSAWCGGLAFTSDTMDDGTVVTTLTGLVADQAALRGILAKLWDLGLTLLSVNQIKPAQGEVQGGIKE